jgi:hypothetical protein
VTKKRGLLFTRGLFLLSYYIIPTQNNSSQLLEQKTFKQVPPDVALDPKHSTNDNKKRTDF